MVELLRIELENFKGEVVETFTSIKKFDKDRELNFEKYQELFVYYIIDFNGKEYALTPNQLHGNETTDNDKLDYLLEKGVNL